ncbi:intraflagellar transport-associated protein isoform X1 [Tursiops truncatus]|uniref:intraflagellar transport-associated protein isoform X1 n=1 Tax=Tursiops truncatus TaxID=9739 RepID=UPI003CCFD13E
MNRNACRIPELEVMDEDRHIEEVLDKFVNCHEQTYEEFLSTFTHLSKDNVTKRGAFGTNSSENNFPSVKFTQRNEPNDHHLSNKAIFLRTSSQCSEEEQIVMDEGQKVGSSFQGDLNRAGKVKVDNFLDLEDLDLDEEIKPQMKAIVLKEDLLHPRKLLQMTGGPGGIACFWKWWAAEAKMTKEKIRGTGDLTKPWIWKMKSECQDLPCCPGSVRITPPNKKERTFLTSKCWKDTGAVTALHSAQATDGLQFPAYLAVTRALGIGQK